MNGGDRLLRILTRLAVDQASPGTHYLCAVAAEITVMTGAGIMLLELDRPQASLCSSDPVSALIEEWQFALGEGPCVDAHTSGRVISEPDLAAPAVARWPAFSPPAVDRGVRAVFGFPVRIGAVRLGALNLYRGLPGPLSESNHADALVMADVVARAILGMQAGAPPGVLAGELEAGVDLQPVVHQAAGMISVQLDVSVAEALVRLRARAFASNRRMTDLAGDVVNRQVRFS
jgi:hypothetical protein